MNYRKYLKSKVRPINEMFDKGDMVYFYNDAGSKVLGRVLSVNGNIYTIEYNGDTYQTNDVMSEKKSSVNELYGIMSYGGRGLSQNDPPDDDLEDKTAASLSGEISDIRNKVAKVVRIIKSGDISGAAKLAVSGFLRYGDSFKEELDNKVGSNAEFKSEFDKVRDDVKNNVKDTDKKDKGSDENN